MAFVRRPVDDPTLLTELVAVDDVVAVLPDDHPLAAEQSIPLAALAKDAWVVPPASASRAYREMLIADCSRSGFEPTIGAEAATPEAITGLVAAGTGVSMLPKGASWRQAAAAARRSAGPARQHGPRTGRCARPARRRAPQALHSWVGLYPGLHRCKVPCTQTDSCPHEPASPSPAHAPCHDLNSYGLGSKEGRA